MRGILGGSSSRWGLILLLAAVGTSCRDSAVPSASPEPNQRATQLPMDVGTSQKWLYRDPPRAFGSAVTVVEIYKDTRCGNIALVQVLDIENHSQPREFWITVGALKRSTTSYEGMVSAEDLRGSMTEGNDLPSGPCENLDRTVAEQLHTIYVWRSVE
jgi:hypothetical protein